MLLTATGVIAAIMLVTAFGHGRDTNVKLKNTSVTGTQTLLCQGKDITMYHLMEIAEQLSITSGGGWANKKLLSASMVNIPEIQTEEIHIRWDVGVCTQDGVSVCNL